MSKSFFDVNLIVDERLLVKNDQKLVILSRKIVLKDFADLMIKLNRFFSKKSELSELDNLMIEDLLYYHENKFKELNDLTIEV